MQALPPLPPPRSGAGPSPAPEAEACARRASKACRGVLTSVLLHPPLHWAQNAAGAEAASQKRVHSPAGRPREHAGEGPTSPQWNILSLLSILVSLNDPSGHRDADTYMNSSAKPLLSPRLRSIRGFLFPQTALCVGRNRGLRCLGQARASLLAQRSNQKNI